MNSFNMKNLFEGMRLLTALGIKEELKNLFLETSNGKRQLTQEQFGYEFLMTILEKASTKNAEAQIYSFLSGILGVEINGNSNPNEVIDSMFAFADMKEWKAFFTRVFSTLTKN